MGKYIVTTFGKWEAERKDLVFAIIGDLKIPLSISKEVVEQALFDDVNSAMMESALAFIRQNISLFPLREVTIKAFQQSLTVVLEALSNALCISKEILEPHTTAFCEQCERSIDFIIDDIMKIGQVSIQVKSTAVDILYGQNFKALYPDLAAKIILQDPELSELARKEIAKTIKPADFGKNEQVIREELIFIDEIAPVVKASEDFEKAFQEKTGTTMKQYKANVAANNPSLWQNPNRGDNQSATSEPRLGI